MDTTVLIIGAGPVGLTMALALLRRGIRFRIVEKSPERTTLSKALAIWPRTLELLDIEETSQNLVNAGHRVVGAQIWAERELLMQLNFEDAKTDFPFGLMLPQRETERILEARLKRAGIDIERGTELVSFEQGDAQVTAWLRNAEGVAQMCRAHWLVACDGAHSTVRHQLPGAEFKGETLPSNWVLADIRMDTELPSDQISTFWDKDGLLLAVPFGNDRFRIIANVGEGDQTHLAMPTLDDIQKILDARCSVKAVGSDPQWISRIVINERKLRDYRFGRIFVVGDSAHVHSPAGGQGMNTGMQDAMNLAWKLAMVIRGEAKSALLDSYSVERSAIGQQVLQNAGRLTRLAIISNPILQQVRAFAMNTLGHFDSVRHAMADQFLELGLRYRHSMLTHELPTQSSSIAPGARVPNAELTSSTAGPASLYGLLSYGRFVVLSVGAPRCEIAAPLQKIAISAEAAEAEGYESGYVYVIRPDAYLAFSARIDDSAQIATLLGALAET